ncbi:unnamed protein product [Eruca vesicaria subsp. sativa]|uniref:Uncharacterized protein n=1 Tax=Eruca vesicaria subsp. sativa TaxID=29727 RepID=A0ABC8KYE9_ERUVS|nr:unnamed protein product [Eruca vesicaria subsp. sativa]
MSNSLLIHKRVLLILGGKCSDSDDWEGEFFPEIPQIKYEVAIITCTICNSQPPEARSDHCGEQLSSEVGVYAYAASQLKKAIEVTHYLGGWAVETMFSGAVVKATRRS